MTPALIIGWMTQAMVVSALLALAALLLQKVAGRALPNRLIWSGALFSSLVLVLVAPLRMAPPSADAVTEIALVGMRGHPPLIACSRRPWNGAPRPSAARSIVHRSWHRWP
jgi:hypothetical protein